MLVTNPQRQHPHYQYDYIFDWSAHCPARCLRDNLVTTTPTAMKVTNMTTFSTGASSEVLATNSTAPTTVKVTNMTTFSTGAPSEVLAINSTRDDGTYCHEGYQYDYVFDWSVQRGARNQLNSTHYREGYQYDYVFDWSAQRGARNQLNTAVKVTNMTTSTTIIIGNHHDCR